MAEKKQKNPAKSKHRNKKILKIRRNGKSGENIEKTDRK